jgi:hypothetical protein
MTAGLSVKVFEDSLEPVAKGAADAAEAAGSRLMIKELAQLSLAISAKRQADALERIVVAVEQLAGELAHPEWGVAPSIRKAHP